ncbi:hypothetical protein K8Q96_01960 [Candidatus Nomurabacteria bacterium]|nr:hypothetical protein [Candidatus Nomurabacteria bacterium]
MEKNIYGFYVAILATVVSAILVLLFKGINIIAIPLYVICILSVVITASGIVKVPNQPPSIGVVTKWGSRSWATENGHNIAVYIKEGLGWLFLKGIMYDVIYVNIAKKEIDFGEQILTTKDKATTKVFCSMSYVPNKQYIINYMNYGKEEGVKNQMINIKEEQLRIWSQMQVPGPQNWTDLLKAKEDATKIILEAICKRILTDDEVKNITIGRAKETLVDFGIDIIRLNITTMEPFGEIYEADIEAEKEKAQAKEEKDDTDTNILLAQELANKLGINQKEAYQMVIDQKIKFDANEKVSLSSVANAFKGVFSKEN